MWRDSVLETSFLSGRLALISQYCQHRSVPNLFERPFILDIDLDVFNTRKAVNPDDDALFHDLINRAIGITIARESWYVRKSEEKGENLSADWLLPRILEHVRAATVGTLRAPSQQ